MEPPFRYWQITTLTAAGQLEHRDCPQAQQWFKARFEDEIAAEELSDRICQDTLWRICQAHPNEASMAQLCLRCWLSHQIVYICIQLARSFGATYGFQATDLWPLVLDDDGKVPATYQSFTMKILASYDPNRGALSTWASRLTKNHRELNNFLLSQGLYRATPWAILNDTKATQLPRFLPHLSPSELDIAAQLLGAYHRVYRRDRITQRTSRGQRCSAPTDEQLQRIDLSQPPNVVLSQLHDLAEQLRQSRVAARGGSLPSQSLDANEYTEPAVPVSDDFQEIQDEFAKNYRQDFLNTLGEAIKVTVTAYTVHYQKRRPPQGRVYRQALELFHCEGRPMGEIAKTLGLNSQVKVTRLLNLKKFRTEVCIYWLNQLKERVQKNALKHLSPDQLDNIADKLEQILNEEADAVMAEAASEAQIPKNRTANSVFARQLCAVVDTLPLPPDLPS
ncbi:hypothetical protein U2F10_33940 [Leptothoe sp. EHU-05/26/07-4]